MKNLFKKLARRLGYEIVNARTFDASLQNLGSADKYLWLNDKAFEKIYTDALRATHKEDLYPTKIRNFTLVELLTLTLRKFEHLPVQHIAECGVARGTTIHEACSIVKELKKPGQTITFHAFDSFEGLSPRVAEDVVNEFVPERSLPQNAIGSGKGVFAHSLESVKENLKEFDFIDYYKGWIPESFKGVPEREYLFVHIDLDLYEPTLAAMEYFYPRLAPGGVIVCDDYGFVAWPGAYKAMEEWGQAHREPILKLTTGQGVVIKGAFQASLT